MIYRDFIIERHEWAGWQFTHKEYDGPEDARIGTASSFIDARCQVDEMIEGIEAGTFKTYKPMEAWSGGFAENH